MKDIDWTKLTFSYTPTDYIVRSHYANGVWSKPYATSDPIIPVHAAATALQYAQQAFEGLKVYRTVDGKVSIFRPEMNAKRMQQSAEAMYMAPVPTDLFIEACELAVRMNIDYLPPYETGATLYIRPILFGTTPKVGVSPAQEFEFCVVVTPIGPYFPAGFGTTPFIINRHVDRAAPLGTGQFKVGGNYAASFRATETAHAAGYDCLFLDSKQHRFIDECSAANFIGIKESKVESQKSKAQIEYLTPKSSAILPSITNDSLMTLAREKGMKVTRRHIRLEELEEMSEAAACGTACVISPIDKVLDPERNKVYSFGNEPGPVMTELYHALKDIQYGRSEDRHGWCEVVER